MNMISWSGLKNKRTLFITGMISFFIFSIIYMVIIDQFISRISYRNCIEKVFAEEALRNKAKKEANKLANAHTKAPTSLADFSAGKVVNFDDLIARDNIRDNYLKATYPNVDWDSEYSTRRQKEYCELRFTH